MKQKFWVLPFLLVLMASTAIAACTVTLNEPASGTIFNNTVANRKTIDVNVNITDTNGLILRDDMNIQLRYWPDFNADAVTIFLDDWNMGVRTNVDQNCSKNSAVGGDLNLLTPGSDCTYTWQMPLNSALPDGSYILDANVVQFTEDTREQIFDCNGGGTITINTRLTTIEATKALLLQNSVILAGITLLSILIVGIAMGGRDMKTWVLLSIASAVSVGIGAMVLGAMVAQM